jgi:putative spermidine/putrescine transport system permease protein
LHLSVSTTLDIETLAGGRESIAAPRQRFNRSWLGLAPFMAFLTLFLLLPAIGVLNKGFHTVDGGFSLEPMRLAFTKERLAFANSVKVSVVTAFLGVVIGTLVAYAAATAKRPKWLRSLTTAFSGVAANMGGVILAFAFQSLLGRQGLGTKVMKAGGFNLYDTSFDLGKIKGFSPGISTVYMYFQIPLMVLVTLPAIDGLKDAWREATASLGGSTWTFWRRVGLPVLAPSMLGGFLLLFANSFSAFATAYALGSGSANVVPLKISFYLQGDNLGKSAVPYALASWMILIMGASMIGYLVLRKRAERWRN